jgi:hypothetical protein
MGRFAQQKGDERHCRKWPQGLRYELLPAGLSCETGTLPLANGVTGMNAADAWRDCFARWPDDLAKRGALVTKFDEQIIFSNFLYSDSLLLIERQSPDTLGARQVILSYDAISAVKIVDVVKLKALAKLGFESQKGTH